MFSYFVGPICCKNLTSKWHEAYKFKTTEAEILSYHIYDMINVLIKCQIVCCTVVQSYIVNVKLVIIHVKS